MTLNLRNEPVEAMIGQVEKSALAARGEGISNPFNRFITKDLQRVFPAPWALLSRESETLSPVISSNLNRSKILISTFMSNFCWSGGKQTAVFT